MNEIHFHRERFVNHRERFVNHRERFVNHRERFVNHRERFVNHRERFVNHRERFVKNSPLIVAETGGKIDNTPKTRLIYKQQSHPEQCLTKDTFVALYNIPP